MSLSQEVIDQCFSALGLKSFEGSFQLVADWFKKFKISENDAINAELYGTSVKPLNPASDEANLSAPHINYILTELCRAIVALALYPKNKEDDDEEEEDSEMDECSEEMEERRKKLCSAVPVCTERAEYLKLIAAVLKSENDDYMEHLTSKLIDVLIDMYYVTMTPKVVELHRHMYAGELMLIDGDSLIIEAMSNCHVDWDLVQPLHIAAIVHRILKSYYDRGFKMHIAFFFYHEWFWKKSPQKRFVRNVIQDMLIKRAAQQNPPFSCFMFISYQHQKFKQYIQQYKPEFILLNDGEQMWPLPEFSSPDSPVNDAPAAEFNAAGTRITAFSNDFRSVLDDNKLGYLAAAEMHRMSLYFISTYRMHIVYTSRQVYRDNDIWTFVVMSVSRNFVPIIAIQKELEKSCSINLRQIRGMRFSNMFPAGLEKLFSQQFNEALQAETPKEKSRLEKIAFVASILMNGASGESDEEEEEEEEDIGKVSLTAQQKDLLKVTLIGAEVMDYLGLEVRQQPVEPCAQIKEFLNIFCNLASELFSLGTSTTFSAYYDILDGHLIAVLAKILALTPLNSLVSADICKRVDAAWGCVVEGAGSITDAPLSTLTDLEIKISDRVTLEALPQKSIHDNTNGLVESNFVRMLEKQFDVSVSSTPIDNPDSSEAVEVDMRLSRFFNMDERFDQENAPFNEEEDRKKRQDEEQDEKRRRQIQRMDVKFLEALQDTADSMGIKPVVIGDRANRIKAVEREKRNAQLVMARNSTQKKVTRSEEIRYKNLMSTISSTTRSNSERFTRLVNRVEQLFLSYKATLNASQLPARLRNLLQAMGELESAQYFNGTQGLDTGYETACQTLFHDLRIRNSSINGDPFNFILNPQAQGLDKLKHLLNDNYLHCERIQKLDADIARLRKLGSRDAEIKKLEAEITAIEPLITAEVYTAEHAERLAVQIYYTMYSIYLTIRSSTIVLETAEALWRRTKTEWARDLDAILVKTQNDPLKIREEISKKDYSSAIRLWDKMHASLKLLQKFGPLPASERDVCIIRAAALNLDLQPSYIEALSMEISRCVISAPEHVPPHLQPLPSLNTQYTSAMFQLLLMGHLLPRDIPPDNDNRVAFNPDLWQRELMDIVDRRGSLIVSAPTSSGKTFISYYCMDEVFSLQQKEDQLSTVVYVAPTRALINQALADIYGRYKNKDYQGRPIHVCGVLGGSDYVRDPYTSQVLVTLPEVLESLLLSPHKQKWLERVRYFIFDEIHTMEDSGNGAIVGRLLALVRAPFIALSATLGETENLVAWLNRTRRRASKYLPSGAINPDHVVHIVPRGQPIQRWSDIEKHIFMPLYVKDFPRGENMETIKLEESECRLLPVHPLSAVTFEAIELKQEFPADLRIVPHDTYELLSHLLERMTHLRKKWGVIKEVSKCEKALEGLCVDSYFSCKRTGMPKLQITQSEARQWELDVKAQLLKWVNMSSKAGLQRIPGCDLSPIREKDIPALLADMKAAAVHILSSFKSEIGEREAEVEKLAMEGKMPFCDTFNYVKDNMWRLFIALRNRDMLPALAFNFSQEDCNRLATALVSPLEEAEVAYRESREFVKYEQQLNTEKEKNERQKLSNKAAKGKIVVKDEEGKIVSKEANEQLDNLRPDSDFIIPEVLSQFTFFQSNYSIMNDPDFMFLVETNKISKTSLIYRCLVRGIGIHHAAIPGHTRQLVERLFRTRKLAIVIATKSLALGIHSPCRTVILAGDNVALNVTEFRQMSGRAGRRGIDFLGHVVFLGISSKKINRLLTCEMSNLRGNALVDATTNLRFMEMYCYDDAQVRFFAKGYAECAFTNPLFEIGRKLTKNYTENALSLFCTLHSFYVNNGFVSLERGGAVYARMLGNLAVNMLHIRRNLSLGNRALVLCSMLAKGFLTEKSHNWSPDQFIFLLSYIACSRYLDSDRCNIPLERHQSVLRDPLLETVRSRNVHTVVLPSPNGAIAEAIEATSKPVLELLSRWAVTRAEMLSEETRDESAQLAFQIIDNNSQEKQRILFVTEKSSLDKVGNLNDELRKTACISSARHPMLALSGKGDSFTCVEDLIHSMRQGIFINVDDIPAIDLVNLNTHSGLPVVLDACLYDFYRFGSQIQKGHYTRYYLNLFNKINSSSSYSTLNEQFTLIKSLAMAINLISTEDFKNITNSRSLYSIVNKCETRATLRTAEIKDYSYEVQRLIAK